MKTMTKLYLTKLSNGVYYIGWIENGKRRWKTTKLSTKSGALQYLREFKGQTQETETIPTTSALIVRFTEVKGHSVRPSTLTLYRFSVERFIEVCGDKPINTYTVSDVDNYKTALVKRGVTKTTVNIWYRSVKAIFGFAIRNGWIEKSPFSRTQQLPIPQETPRFITKDELRVLLEKVKEPVLRDIFLFASLTGLRLSEILSLTWDKIDFTKKHILVSNTDTFVTKTGKVRSVPMHEVVESLLRGRFRGNGYVFCKENGFPLLGGYVSHRFKEYVRECGLSEKLHFHSLRHTAASWLVDAGVSLYEIMTILGHSNISTTQIYSHLSQTTLLQSVNKVSL